MMIKTIEPAKGEELMLLSKRIQSIEPSPTLAMNAKAVKMKQAGVDVISFGVGEPDFDTPEHIREAAKTAMDEGMTRYTAVGGIPELKEAIVTKFSKDNNLTYRPEEVMVSCGGKHVLYNLAQAILDPGDEVIIPAPYWVSYPPIAVLADAKPVILQTSPEDHFKLSPKTLRNAITERTKLLVLNSPSNPTGGVYSRAELEGLAEVVQEHHLFVVSDEIYEKLIFDDVPFVSIAQLGNDIKARTLIVNGVSKTYAMTGWRIGYAAGDSSVIAAMTKIQSQSTSNPNSIAQRAAIAALTGPQDSVREMVKTFAERRIYLTNRLNGIPGVHCTTPEGAFYAFADFSNYFGKQKVGQTITGSANLCEFLLTEGRVALVPGVAFGADDFIRFSFATSLELIEKGLGRIESTLEALA